MSRTKPIVRIALGLWSALVGLSVAQMADQKAQEEQLARETLRGLSGVAVRIEDLAPLVVQKGLRKDLLHIDVERALREAEIRVLSAEERQTTPGTPTLSVRITTLQIGGGHCLHVEVALKQMITLKRDPHLDRLATTWQTRIMGAGTGFDVPGLHQVVLGQVNEFITAYRAVNPGARQARMRPVGQGRRLATIE